MRYVGKIYRPPSEANAYILQATIGCSHNLCTYCDMYRDKPVFSVRELKETLMDIELARRQFGQRVEKVFVADGDALFMETEHWLEILQTLNAAFPRLKRVSCYAMAENILVKSDDELRALKAAGLTQLYIGPESGHDRVLKKLVKGATAADHVEAAKKAHAAEMKMSVIFLLGAGGLDLSEEHAVASAKLATEMDPEFLSALTITVVPNTPLERLAKKGRFEVPDVKGLLKELRTFIDLAEPTNALFRTNHASNYLPLAGRLPQDRGRIVEALDKALAGEIALRPEWSRGL